MAVNTARQRLGQIFAQRCFYLFVVLLVLVGAVPFVEPTPSGRLAVNVVNLFVMVATVAAVGRTTLSFVVALLLAAPTLGFQWIHVSTDHSQSLIRSWEFASALYLAAIVYLLRYVFQRDVMTADRLFGAAAAYLMIGIFWAYVFALVGSFYPRAFAVFGTAGELSLIDAMYFSFTVLTSTGFGDITPLIPQARGLCIVEQVIGTLFLAVLIARLAGVYPPLPHDRT